MPSITAQRTQIPVGQSIPSELPHAISVSLPTWTDVVAYEEGEPWIVACMQTGYPRFFIHRSIQKVSSRATRELESDDGDGGGRGSPHTSRCRLSACVPNISLHRLACPVIGAPFEFLATYLPPSPSVDSSQPCASRNLPSQTSFASFSPPLKLREHADPISKRTPRLPSLLESSNSSSTPAIL